MTLVRLSPFSDFDAVHSQMNRIFDELTGWQQESNSAWKPPVELLNQEAALVLKASLPGITKEDIEVSLTRNTVHITGEYKHQSEQENQKAYYSEFRYGKFDRSITLPTAIKHEEVTADFVDGILTLTLPKVVPTSKKVVKLNLSDTKSDTVNPSSVNPTDTHKTNS